MATISFKNVDKIYDNNVQAVFDFNLDVQDKEFIVLVGPSGCGKSTTLRMLAGFEDISGGTISIDGKVVNNLAPKDRDIAMVFQNYALYPHMTVYDNMAFALKLRKVPKIVYDENNQPIMEIDQKLVNDLTKQLEKLQASNADESLIKETEAKLEEAKNNPVPKTVLSHYNKQEINEKIMSAAEILGLVPYLKRKPAALSGGQRQRVALGRAIVRTPKVFLMDEPLSNLDAKLRVQTRSEISKIHDRVGATTIYVTHDQTEAMTMADRIVIMKDGYIQQIGTPKEVYENPSNIFVAGFIGSPSMNFFNGVFDGEYFAFEGSDIKIKLPKEHCELLKDYVGKTIVFGIRPEDVHVAEDKGAENKSEEFKVECDISELLGYESIVYGYIGEQRITIKISSKFSIETGDVHSYVYDTSKARYFDAETSLAIK